MSHFLDRLTFFKRRVGTFSNGHGITTNEPRDWEDSYRKRWQHDKIVCSTHGVNCTGSCSWRIYVKGGIVTWETQQTDYPRTRPDLPNHEPRGCACGASYSWYLYSTNRMKHPMVRGRLLKLWREARATLFPVAAWGASGSLGCPCRGGLNGLGRIARQRGRVTPTPEILMLPHAKGINSADPLAQFYAEGVSNGAALLMWTLAVSAHPAPQSR